MIVRAVGNRLNRWGLLLGVFLAALFFLLRDSLPRVFTSDPAVLAALAGVFPLLVLMQVPNAILFVLDGVLIGASDSRFLRNSMIALGLLGVIDATVQSLPGTGRQECATIKQRSGNPVFDPACRNSSPSIEELAGAGTFRLPRADLSKPQRARPRETLRVPAASTRILRPR